MKASLSLCLACFCALALAFLTPAASAATGDISTVAGDGTASFGGDGGPATAAKLNQPYGNGAFDASGNFYFADQSNSRIRKVDTSGNISTVAGDGTFGFGGDGGPATAAKLNQPYGVALDAAGNLYIADRGNDRVRKVDTSGNISTIAGDVTGGFGGDGGPATAAQLNNPFDVALDAAGNLYIADSANHRVRKVDTSGDISTVAGDGTSTFGGDGGPATSAKLNNPLGIALDAAGNLYIADTSNHRVRKVDASGDISTVAGDGGTGGFGGDGGPATSAKLNLPWSVLVDAAGNLFIADYVNHRVRKVNTSGNISTVAGDGTSSFGGDGGPATAAKLNFPSGLATDNKGNLFIADSTNHRIRRVKGIVAVPPLAGPADTWSLWYGYAIQYFQYYAAFGYWDYAYAFYYYYNGIGQQNYYNAYGSPALGIYSYYAGLAQYYQYSLSSYGGTLGSYYAYLYFAYAYYYYFATLGDYSSANAWFNAYYGAALAL